MIQFSIEFTDDHARRLSELADEAGKTPEDLLAVSVREWLDTGSSDFTQAATYVLQKNAELYRRLPLINR